MYSKIEDKLPLFLVLTGPSGSGKSTAIKQLYERTCSERIVIPLRVTTRPARVSDNPLEVKSISINEFEEGRENGTIKIAHRIRDKWNGLVFPTLLNNDRGVVLTQALPTSAGVHIKETMSGAYCVVVVRLKASKNTVLTRLSQRGPNDDAPAVEAAARAMLTPVGNDVELNAELSIEKVAVQLQYLIRCYFDTTTPEFMNRVLNSTHFRACAKEPVLA